MFVDIDERLEGHHRRSNERLQNLLQSLRQSKKPPLFFRKYFSELIVFTIHGLFSVLSIHGVVPFNIRAPPVKDSYSRILQSTRIRPRLHETGTKSNRDHFVSVIVLFIINVYMRPGRK